MNFGVGDIIKRPDEDMLWIVTGAKRSRIVGEMAYMVRPLVNGGWNRAGTASILAFSDAKARWEKVSQI